MPGRLPPIYLYAHTHTYTCTYPQTNATKGIFPTHTHTFVLLWAHSHYFVEILFDFLLLLPHFPILFQKNIFYAVNHIRQLSASHLLHLLMNCLCACVRVCVWLTSASGQSSVMDILHLVMLGIHTHELRILLMAIQLAKFLLYELSFFLCRH